LIGVLAAEVSVVRTQDVEAVEDDYGRHIVSRCRGRNESEVDREFGIARSADGLETPHIGLA
jgi:hypothetical protein